MKLGGGCDHGQGKAGDALGAGVIEGQRPVLAALSSGGLEICCDSWGRVSRNVVVWLRLYKSVL